MLTVISPAKRLDWAARDVDVTQPRFTQDAEALAEVAKTLSVGDLEKLMDISKDLATLNHDRFQRFADDKADMRPAALAFAGDTYAGLEAKTLSPDDLRFAQDRLRILSGLYGVLRPMDAIQQYRLEMGSRLKNPRGKSLYDYWGTQISEALNSDAAGLDADTLINCASIEYFSAVQPEALKLRIITPVFLEDKPNGPKIVSFYAKKARGAMARFIIENRLTDPANITEFDAGGYRYSPDLSEHGKPAFLRSEADAKAA